MHTGVYQVPRTFLYVSYASLINPLSIYFGSFSSDREDACTAFHIVPLIRESRLAYFEQFAWEQHHISPACLGVGCM